ncbi:MAG: LLM class flavin-dependent oxidoreductase [Chloroflexi bacterium]|nr:LLM class flavin-dependent oxidoreductase [Chloroflexota bacterium]MCI0841745.1 LLM class flavin-dependent oxidoreductase [Chloroflexota bacterium]
MKLALQYEMQRPSLDDHLVLQETMEQCILADEVGFDYLWFVEHHFLTGFSASPCPDLVFAALSQRTKQIRLGLGVVILPYHHPNRVAERVAMLDHLSEGRVDFGTGRSAPYELTGMGIDPRDSREMWEESLAMVPKIWASDLFSYEGKYWQVPERQVLPKPYQKPHPPIWVAALQPSTYDLAADKGIGVLAFGSSAPSSLEPYVRAYKERVKNADPVGAFVNDQWASSTLGICLEDDAEAKRMGAQSLKNFFGPDRPYVQGQKDIYAQLLERWGGVPEHLQANFSRYVALEGETEAKENILDYSGGAAIANKIWDEMDADTLCDRAVVIAGNPDSCIEALKKHEATGIDQMMIMMQTESIPHEKVMESIELFGKYVIPEFKP